MRPALPNPAWSNCALLRSWEAIEAHVGASMMPKVTKHTVDRLTAVEYGHGVYGVVMPTQGRTGMVAKITSDPTEAHFATVYRSLPHKPEGVTKYGPIYMLPGARQGRPLFVLWREEAFDVGHVLSEKSDADMAAADLLNAIFDETIPTCNVACSSRASPQELTRVRESAKRYIRDTGYEAGDGPGFFKRAGVVIGGKDNRAGFGIAAATALAKELARYPKMAAVARAILELMKQGVVVTDLHLGNFGNVRRGSRKIAVITDPGNVAFVTTRFDKTWPPRVTDGLPAGMRERLAVQPAVKCAR